MKSLLSVILTVLFIIILLLGVIELPEFGKLQNPQNNYVTERYLNSAMEETGALNIVTSIILDYRAFDTFGEAVVLFVAVISVVALLQERKGQE